METQPWEHPHWYDLHDTAHTAGPEREPEHYRELLLALPPLDRDDHLADVGAGTGKLALVVAQGYPTLGRVTLIEPNERKLALAQERLSRVLPHAQVTTIAAGLGVDAGFGADPATVVTIGSVLMPIMLLRGGTLADGLAWLDRALREVSMLVAAGGWLYTLETLGAPWDRGSALGPVRRLNMREFTHALEDVGFTGVECMYRFRDRVILRGQKLSG